MGTVDSSTDADFAIDRSEHHPHRDLVTSLSGRKADQALHADSGVSEESQGTNVLPYTPKPLRTHSWSHQHGGSLIFESSSCTTLNSTQTV